MRILVFNFLILFFSACCAQKAKTSSVKSVTKEVVKKSVVYNEIYASQNSGFEKPTNFVINNNAEYEAMFDKLPNEGIPEVNFTSQNVIVLSLGEINTGGYDIKIDKVEETDNNIVVYVKTISPKPNDMVTMAFTNPVSIYTIGSKKEVIFKGVVFLSKN